MTACISDTRTIWTL